MNKIYTIKYKYPGQAWEVLEETSDKETANYLYNEYCLSFRGQGQVKLTSKIIYP